MAGPSSDWLREREVFLGDATMRFIVFAMLAVWSFARFADGEESRNAGASERPTVLIFSKGADCIHCTEQYQAFEAISAEFQRYGVDVKFVTPDAAPSGGTGSPFAEIRDEDGSSFRRYSKDARSDHGTFVISPNGGVAWSQVGLAAYMDARAALSAAVHTEIQVEVEINDTPETTDDYLTWAPTPARMRLSRNAPGGGDVNVVLTNDAESPVPAGRTLPLDGNLMFAEAVTAGHTASNSTLARVLPADGSWVPFVVAGQFPRASTADGDAIIEAHLDTADGPLVGNKSAMVRVRKELNSLTPEERVAYLKALHDLHFVQKQYERLPTMHDLAAKGKESYFPFDASGNPHPQYYPDQAHGGSAFLPWHRAFLLLIERDLQKINPAVTIPYWRQNAEAQPAFNVNFLGSNRDDAIGVLQSEVLFSPTNWLYGWSIEYQNLKTVIRNSKDYTTRLLFGTRPLVGDKELFESATPADPTYARFAASLETNPHNMGHGAIGMWHANCLISPSDPSFWSFHAEDDRLWAKWQWTYGRFDATGADGGSYDHTSSFVANEPDSTFLGHNLQDKMWPWDGSKGEVVPDAEGKGRRPPENPTRHSPKLLRRGCGPRPRQRQRQLTRLTT